MFFYFLQTKPKHRKATLWVMLVLFAFSVFPLPVSILHQTPEPTIDSTPFPCQGGTCGCRDAKTCWTNCCCRTPAERLAWASEKGIKPPSYAILSSDATVDECVVLIKREIAKKPARSCCSRKTDSCCSKAAEGMSSCKSSDSGAETTRSCCSQKKHRDTSTVSKRSKWVTWMEAAKCRGIRFDLTNLPVCDVAIPVVFHEEFRVGERVYFRASPSIDIEHDVPHPPPRASLS